MDRNTQATSRKGWLADGSRKVRLDIDALTVESFDAGTGAYSGGTVGAHSFVTDTDFEPTCAHYNTCGPLITECGQTCEASCEGCNSYETGCTFEPSCTEIIPTDHC